MSHFDQEKFSRRRNQFKSFIESKGRAIKDYYYASPSLRNLESSATTLIRERGLLTRQEEEPFNNRLKQRTDTQDIEAILQESLPESVQPQCMLFPTYACQVEANNDKEKKKYKVVIAGWAFAQPGSSRLDRFLLAAGRKYGGLARNSVEDNHFSTLLNQFRCQTMRMVDVKLTLPGILAQKLIQDNEDHLSLGQQERIRDFAASVNTGPSGRFKEVIYLDEDSVKRLKEQTRYLTVQASFCLNENEEEERASNNDACTESTNAINRFKLTRNLDSKPLAQFPGFIDIIEPYGISIISDIDDTIKITDVLDGKDAILKNTLFSTAREVPHMSEVYRAWASEGAHIHYVSNSPWQVYPALNDFMTDKKFPQGSVHLRAVSTQQLIRGKPGRHKLEAIAQIFADFPHRKFILVGDSGEIDPEIYEQIYLQYPEQVIKIFIHDVTSLRARNADRVQQEKPDSYYRMIVNFLTRESQMYRKNNNSSQLAMDAMAHTEVPEEQQEITDPDIPLKNKLEQFEERMTRISGNMREGVFTVFTLASQLITDPVVAEEFLMAKTNTQLDL